MHASITIDGEVLMASDAPPGHSRSRRALRCRCRSTIPPTPSASSRRWPKAARVNMPFGKTFFSKGFGMCVDQFGIPWMVNCPMEECGDAGYEA